MKRLERSQSSAIRSFPPMNFPSASQAGVLTYIDRQLTRHYRRHQDAYRPALIRLRRWPPAIRHGTCLAFTGQQYEIVSDLSSRTPVL